MREPLKSLYLHVEVQPLLREAVELGAQQNFTSISDYVRRALVTQLASDGIDPHDARPCTRPAASAGPAAAGVERHVSA
jgi:hypothetical protein